MKFMKDILCKSKEDCTNAERLSKHTDELAQIVVKVDELINEHDQNNKELRYKFLKAIKLVKIKRLGIDKLSNKWNKERWNLMMHAK